MKKKKNIHAVLKKERPDHTPIWLMRQAGRYLPEYKETRARAGSFMKLCFTPELAAEVTLQPVRRFGMDGAILFSDILVVPYGLGLALEFVEGEGPKLERVETKIPEFHQEGFFARVSPIFETVKLTCPQLPQGTSMIGFAGAPWTVACYMMGGRGSDEFKIARTRAYADPEGFQGVINVLVRATIFYLKEQIKAGAEIIQIFDSWAGLVPGHKFEQWVIAPTRKIVEGLKAEFPEIPVIGFPRMAGSNLKAYAEQTGVDAVSLDQTVNLKWAQENLKLPLQGNLDPLLMAGPKEILLREAETILRAMKTPFIFNLGHGLTPDVPPENVEALVKFVQGFPSPHG